MLSLEMSVSLIYTFGPENVLELSTRFETFCGVP